MKTVLLTLVLAFASFSFAANPVDQLPAAVAKKHLAISDNACDTDLSSNVEAHDLGQGYTLYLVPCYMGAYQGSWYGYIAKGEQVNPVIVLSHDEAAKAFVADMNLIEPGFDEKTKTLTTFAKGRGLGDCGQTSVSQIIVTDYGYVTVKTTEIRSKVKCDGKYRTWPVVFKQK